MTCFNGGSSAIAAGSKHGFAGLEHPNSIAVGALLDSEYEPKIADLSFGVKVRPRVGLSLAYIASAVNEPLLPVLIGVI